MILAPKEVHIICFLGSRLGVPLKGTLFWVVKVNTIFIVIFLNNSEGPNPTLRQTHLGVKTSSPGPGSQLHGPRPGRLPPGRSSSDLSRRVNARAAFSAFFCFFFFFLRVFFCLLLCLRASFGVNVFPCLLACLLGLACLLSLLAWLGLAWLGLAWLGLAWPGLAWLGLLVC